MTRRDAFAGYHPCVNFIFYALVLVFSMCLMHPAYLAVSFFCAAGCTGVDEMLLGMLISTQFESYRRIVADCPDARRAEQCMQSLMTYHFGGWAALFASKIWIQGNAQHEV